MSTRFILYPMSTRVYPESTRFNTDVLLEYLEAIISQYLLEMIVVPRVHRVYHVLRLAILRVLVVLEPVVSYFFPTSLAMYGFIIILGLSLFFQNFFHLFQITVFRLVLSFIHRCSLL